MRLKKSELKFFRYGKTLVIFVDYTDGRFQVLVANPVLKTYNHDLTFRYLIFADQSGLAEEISGLTFDLEAALLGLPDIENFLENEIPKNLATKPFMPKIVVEQQLEKTI